MYHFYVTICISLTETFSIRNLVFVIIKSNDTRAVAEIAAECSRCQKYRYIPVFLKKNLNLPLFLKRRKFLLVLKETVSREFSIIFLIFLKDSTWAPYEQAKTVLSRTFSFLRIYSITKFENRVSA